MVLRTPASLRCSKGETDDRTGAGNATNAGQFLLNTDASDNDLGAVLSQIQGDREVVIAYASRMLSRSEKTYCTTKKELLAVVYGLKTFKQYLLERHFTVRTAYSALTWLRRTPEPLAQQASNRSRRPSLAR